MDEPQGKVLALVRGEDRVVVDVDVRAVCPRCASGRGCGAAMFAGRRKTRRLQALLAPGVEVAEGDTVTLVLEPRELLNAAAIVYGLPLLGTALAAAGAYLLGFGDAGAALAAVAGLLGGMAAVRRRLDRRDCLTRFVPTVSERVGGRRCEP